MLSFSWTGDDDGWVAGFADYPRGVEKDWNFTSARKPLPSPLQTGHLALFIGGDNHSDDLFMFWKRRISGLAPGRSYDASFTITLLSNAAKGCTGVGGAPGESVWVKAGIATSEPTLSEDSDDVRISTDKGNQAVGGREANVVGDVATTNTDCKARRWETKVLRSKEPIVVNADSGGNAWILLGTDSGFEARTEIYYASVELTLAVR